MIVIGALHATLRASVSRGIDTLLGVQAGYVLVPLEATLEQGESPIRTRGGIAGPLIGVSVGLSGIL